MVGSENSSSAVSSDNLGELYSLVEKTVQGVEMKRHTLTVTFDLPDSEERQEVDISLEINDGEIDVLALPGAQDAKVVYWSADAREASR